MNDYDYNLPTLSTYPIHGHHCNHNLFNTYDYPDLVEAVANGYIHPTQLRRAIHPYTNPCEYDWLTILEDFGITSLTDEIYLPLTDLTPEQLLEIQIRDWDWLQVTSGTLQTLWLVDPDSYYYKSLYTPVKDIISTDDWVRALKNGSR